MAQRLLRPKDFNNNNNIINNNNNNSSVTVNNEGLDFMNLSFATNGSIFNKTRGPYRFMPTLNGQEIFKVADASSPIRIEGFQDRTFDQQNTSFKSQRSHSFDHNTSTCHQNTSTGLQSTSPSHQNTNAGHQSTSPSHQNTSPGYQNTGVCNAHSFISNGIQNQTGSSNSLQQSDLKTGKPEILTESEEVKMETKPIITLLNWAPSLSGDDLCVEGDIRDADPTSGKSAKRMTTSKVVGVDVRGRLIHTESTDFFLEGNLGNDFGGETVPSFLKIAFRHGFPAEWNEYRLEWIIYRELMKALAAETPNKRTLLLGNDNSELVPVTKKKKTSSPKKHYNRKEDRAIQKIEPEQELELVPKPEIKLEPDLEQKPEPEAEPESPLEDELGGTPLRRSERKRRLRIPLSKKLMFNK